MHYARIIYLSKGHKQAACHVVAIDDNKNGLSHWTSIAPSGTRLIKIDKISKETFEKEKRNNYEF